MMPLDTRTHPALEPVAVDTDGQIDPLQAIMIKRGIMIFNTLYDSALRGELMLINNGLCHWHLRRDGQITIREIISTHPGAGKTMLQYLISIGNVKGATSIFAKCPADLDANRWYEKREFSFEGIETTRTGKELKLWRLRL